MPDTTSAFHSRNSPERTTSSPWYSALSRRTTMDADAGGNAQLYGTFDVGEGKYHVDWLMRDRSERICSFNWDAEAQLPARDKQIALDIGPSVVQPAETEPFK